MIPPEGVETILGISADPVFGPVVVCGLGGIFVELLKDSTLQLPPVSRDEARRMIFGLKGSGLFEGFRGRPRADAEALAAAIIQIGQLAVDFRGKITALDINPLIVLPQGRGVVAADLFIEMGPGEDIQNNKRSTTLKR
jgi:acetyltransferase